MRAPPLRFEQVHIDVARNSTDDFNPFHDPLRWQHVEGNPFGGTIALGFQMEFLAADRIARHRRAAGEPESGTHPELPFVNYEFVFTGALRAGERLHIAVRKTIDRLAQGGGLSNRVTLRKDDGELVLMGTQTDTREPRFLADTLPVDLPSLEHLPDRTHVPGTPYFNKRKFLNTSNGKNFALGALSEQQDYFDELAERIHFPPLFTASLLSCALLEKGRAEGYDFEADPMVYTSHHISVDNRLQARLRSNDRLYVLIEGPLPADAQHGLSGSSVAQQVFRCFGMLHGREVLFRADVRLAPLHAFVNAQRG